MQASNVNVVFPAAQKLLDAARGSQDFADLTSDMQNNNPQINVDIDRTRAAAALGVTADAIESALYDAYGSRQVSTIYTPSNEYEVIVELMPQYQHDLSALGLLFVRSQAGTLIPLRAVASLSKSVGPVTINHSGQLPSVTISFNLAAGVSLGAATADMQRLANQSLPTTGGITTAFSGTAQVFQSTQAGLLVLVVLAISSSSTSCLACSMRVLYIRSRFSPDCLSRHLVLCSHCGSFTLSSVCSRSSASFCSSAS